MELKVACVHCKNEYSLQVKKEDYENWINKKQFIQDLMPYLNPAERELLISKTCAKCWKEMFGDEE